jgi:hypothetical protein
MSAVKANSLSTAIQTPAAQAWQVDRARRTATHISGLAVQWHAVKEQTSRVPALDISGIGKIKNSVWANQLDGLINEAIALLEA